MKDTRVEPVVITETTRLVLSTGRGLEVYEPPEPPAERAVENTVIQHPLYPDFYWPNTGEEFERPQKAHAPWEELDDSEKSPDPLHGGVIFTLEQLKNCRRNNPISAGGVAWGELIRVHYNTIREVVVIRTAEYNQQIHGPGFTTGIKVYRGECLPLAEWLAKYNLVLQ